MSVKSFVLFLLFVFITLTALMFFGHVLLTFGIVTTVLVWLCMYSRGDDRF